MAFGGNTDIYCILAVVRQYQVEEARDSIVKKHDALARLLESLGKLWLPRWERMSLHEGMKQGLCLVGT